ncbi:hypothetical protein L1047_13875 [Synechococcus sp. Nb3U1]|uniref:hypothetical protein n=1 Tax=Synechococcus sp. Nb3U1 TaxID=1914529 RepID=UPI001F2CE871|nr:hypothetical protein [Synechococcus sp. Nb3U1]MCF2972285.1 hypothetical protein [Synechococcus sp. Nb3U1]
MSGYDASAGGRRSPWRSGQARQADSLLDDLFDDLERSLDEGGSDVEEYPYFGTRPPLRSRRSHAAGGMLLGMALAATCVAGLAFWVTLRPQPWVFSKGELPFLAEDTNDLQDDLERDPLLAAPASLLGQESETPFTPEDLPKVTEENPSATTITATATATESAPARAVSPVASAPSAPPAPPPVPVRIIPPQPVPQMKLVGLIHDPGAPKALILIDNVVRQVPVGQAVKAEWRVTSISPYGVGVSNGAQSVTLQLGLTQRI